MGHEEVCAAPFRFFSLQGGVCRRFFCAAGNVGCLIASINEANANGEENTIFLDAGIFTLRFEDNVTEGPNGLPSITSQMTIRGPDNVGSTIERDLSAPLLRIFHVASNGNLTLTWLAIRQGRILGRGEALGGGAAVNRGTLTVNNSAITNN